MARSSRMRKRAEKNRQQGMALVFTLLGITILSMLAASLMFVSSAGTFASLSFQSQMQATFAANTGLQAALNWFRTYYAPNWLDTSTGKTTTGTAYSPFTTQPPRYNSNAVTLGGSSNFPDGTNTVQTSFALLSSSSNNQITMGNTTGSYTLTAELRNHDRYTDMNSNTLITERWKISVVGTVAGKLGDSRVQETAIFERMFVPMFKDAIRGQCTVDLKGAITTDSYFSSAGGYDVSGNKFTGVAAQASVGSNSFISEVGCGGSISGNAYYGDTSGSCTGAASWGCPSVVTNGGGSITQAPGVPFATIQPAFTDLTNHTTEVCGNNDVNLNPNGATTGPTGAAPPAVNQAVPTTGGHYGSCNTQGNTVVTLCVPGRTDPANPQYFFFNTIDVGSKSVLKVAHQNATGGCNTTIPCDGSTNKCAPVKIYINENMSLGGGGVVGMIPNDPPGFAVFYTGINLAKYAGGPAFYGTIYAPNATLDLQGGTKIYGAVAARNITDAGTVDVHYDLTLQSQTGTITLFQIINQTRNVF